MQDNERLSLSFAQLVRCRDRLDAHRGQARHDAIILCRRELESGCDHHGAWRLVAFRQLFLTHAHEFALRILLLGRRAHAVALR